MATVAVLNEDRPDFRLEVRQVFRGRCSRRHEAVDVERRHPQHEEDAARLRRVQPGEGTAHLKPPQSGGYESQSNQPQPSAYPACMRGQLEYSEKPCHQWLVSIVV